MDGDSPSDIESKINRFKSMKRRAIARLNYIRKNGLSVKQIEAIPLEHMETLIAERYAQLIQEASGQGLSEDQAKEKAQKALAEEFGLVY
jgi:DNA-binding transcriptional regulator YhcF (GntR family)